MGWGPGYEPKDGDGPHDLFGKLQEFVPRLFAPFDLNGGRREIGSRRKLDVDPRYVAWELVGLIQLVLEAGLPVPYLRVEQAVEGLAALAKDEEWRGRWRHPWKHHRSLQKWLSLLSRVVRRRGEELAKRRALRKAAKRGGRRIPCRERVARDVYRFEVLMSDDAWQRSLKNIGRPVCVRRVVRRKKKAS